MMALGWYLRTTSLIIGGIFEFDIRLVVCHTKIKTYKNQGRR